MYEVATGCLCGRAQCPQDERLERTGTHTELSWSPRGPSRKLQHAGTTPWQHAGADAVLAKPMRDAGAEVNVVSRRNAQGRLRRSALGPVPVDDDDKWKQLVLLAPAASPVGPV